MDSITKTYQKYGVDASHLGIIFPWFGCDFVCLDKDCTSVAKKPKSERILPGDSNSGNTPHGGDGCGIGVDAGPGYAEVLLCTPLIVYIYIIIYILYVIRDWGID